MTASFDPAPIPAAARPLALAAVEDLPVYPIGRHERLDGNSFVKWQTARWMASRTFKLMAWEAQGMHRALFDLCQFESPVGTLPDHDDELAAMLRVDARRLGELRRMEFGPFRNWRRCLCPQDGGAAEVRLMHPVVLEQVQDALERHAVAALSKEEKAVAQRRARLVKALEAEGLKPEVTADPVLIGRIDEWMAQSCRGRRNQAAYRSAILHAARCRWFDGGWRGA